VPRARPPLRRWPARAAAAAVGCWCLTGGAAAQPAIEPVQTDQKPIVTTNDYGGVGLMQTRNARFNPDGFFTIGYSIVDEYRRLALTWQPLPWVEATFRYTDIRNRLFSGVQEFSGDQTFKDRGADVKFLLLPESRYLPQVALGLQDGLGTGQFAGEYFAFSKRWYDFDFTFGVGWGYFASGSGIENPLLQLSDSFRSRTFGSERGGALNFGSYFGGETIGLFGGVEWHTPIQGLVLKVEYDPNDYQNEPLGNVFPQDLPINFGAVWRPYDWVEMSLGLERGNTLMSRITLRADLNNPGLPKFDSPPAPMQVREPPARPAGAAPAAVPPAAAPPRADERRPPDPAAVPDDADAEELLAATDALFDGLAALHVEVAQVAIEGTEARIELKAPPPGGAERVLAEIGGLAFAVLPPTVERLNLALGPGAGARSVAIDRVELQRLETVDGLFDRLERFGLAVESIDVVHDEVRIGLAAPPRQGFSASAAAVPVLAALPGNVRRAVFVEAAGGRAIAVERGEARTAARVDALFAYSDAQNLPIDGIDLEEGRAIIRLARPPQGGDYVRLARSLAETLGDGVDEVELHGPGGRGEAEVLARLFRSGPAERIAPVRQPQPTGILVAEPSEEEKRAIAERVFQAVGREGMGVEALHLERQHATLFVTPGRYRQTARNIGRAAKAAASNLPPQIEELTVAFVNGGVEVSRVTLLRSDLEALATGKGSAEEIWNRARIEAPPGALSIHGTLPDDAILNPAAYPNLSFSVRPNIRQFIGGPEGFLLYDAYIAASASAELYRGLSVDAAVLRSLFGTFDDLRTPSDSQLPRVRSDIQQYLRATQESFALSNLSMEYAFQPAQDVYARVYGGLLEEMYGGFGAEVLWRPYGARYAVAVDYNRVRQRDFNQRFDFRDYRVDTGHVSLYYKLPFWNLLGEVRAGQFLAGDRGAQFRVSRRFDSGVSIGAWATFTDVPFDVFGEGSFDKGFFISVPFDLFLLQSSRSVGTFAFRPLTRDGGQILGTGSRLYGRVDSGNIDSLARDWDRFAD